VISESHNRAEADELNSSLTRYIDKACQQVRRTVI